MGTRSAPAPRVLRPLALVLPLLPLLLPALAPAQPPGGGRRFGGETPAAPARAAERRPDYQPAAYAVVKANVVVAPGRTVPDATLVVRDGRIVAFGPAAQIEPPADAKVLDGSGITLTAGWIDAHATPIPPSEQERSKTGIGRPIPYGEFSDARTPPDNRFGITPEYRVAEALDLAPALQAERRAQGFTDLLVAPGGPIVSGRSAWVGLNGLARRDLVRADSVALHIALSNPYGSGFASGDECCTAGSGRLSPASIAHDHDHDHAHDHDRDRDHDRGDSGVLVGTGAVPIEVVRGTTGGYPSALMGVIAHLRQNMIDAERHRILKGNPDPAKAAAVPYDPALEALDDARAKRVPVWWEANTRDEILRALDLSREFGTTCVIVGGREAHKVASELFQASAPVVLRLDFEEAPEVPSAEEYAKRPVDRRLEPLRALEQRKAEWLERVNAAKTLRGAGVKLAFAFDRLPRGATVAKQLKTLLDNGLPADDLLDILTRSAADVLGVSDAVGTLEPGKLARVVAWTKPLGDADAKPKWLIVDHTLFDLEPPRPADAGPAANANGAPNAAEPRRRPGGGGPPDRDRDQPRPARPDAPADKPDSAPADEAAKPNKPEADAPADKPEADKPEAKSPDAAIPIDTPTEFDVDRVSKIKTGGTVFLKNAVVLTVTKGTLPKASILVRDGKIAAVGADLAPPEGVLVIDAEGLVIMPGMIDTHSHQAIAGGVNEATLSAVPEVRVRDVVRGDDVGIYRAAAGGTTAARLLHGSANAIGGQDAVIKHKYGLPGRDLLVNDGPRGVKFALGENVIRSRTRFPNTRMGVESVIRRSFEQARAYRAEWEAYGAARAAGAYVDPPRRDLRLEALVGILDGSIKVHSHCYRADEILMLLNLAESQGIKIQSLQHVLDGYKIAPEIAAHGATASTFSDWWAYKLEAYDATPYNAALLTEAGVRVCIKSDDPDLIRHLNLEAAKMVRYGGVSEEQALAMVTINPAHELGLEHRLGSIEVGKDADLAIFNAHPFDVAARCEMTLVDGEVWFHRPGAEERLRARSGDHTVMPLRLTASPDAKLALPAENPRGLYAIVNANVHPVSGPTIEKGVVVVDRGRILAVGGSGAAIPDGATVIDAEGFDVWPGLIDAGSAIGLFEIGSQWETQDQEDSAPIQPELLAVRALHPESEVIPVTRAAGVLTSFVHPMGGSISGRGGVIRHDGWVPAEMTIVENAALCVNIPPALGDRAEPEQTRRRDERIAAIRNAFRTALEYDKVVSGKAERREPPVTHDPRLEALVPYARGELPVMFEARTVKEIRDAVALAEELGLKAIVAGADEAWKIADWLKSKNVPVVINGTLKLPGRIDPHDAAYFAPAKLAAAGVPFAIRSILGSPPEAHAPRNLPFEAGWAAGYGLSLDEALRAVTLAPAEILGVADRLGSIEPGKFADLVVTKGHVLQPTSRVELLFLAGKPVPPESKHTRLYEKYRGRLRDVRDGKAAFGLVAPRPGAEAPVGAAGADEPADAKRTVPGSSDR